VYRGDVGGADTIVRSGPGSSVVLLSWAMLNKLPLFAFGLRRALDFGGVCGDEAGVIFGTELGGLHCVPESQYFGWSGFDGAEFASLRCDWGVL
jgi:hypothetical protein